MLKELSKCQLCVNLDHVATLRQARQTSYPSLLEAATVVAGSRAAGVTLHLREDRRHVQDSDLSAISQWFPKKFNLEMSCHPEIVGICLQLRPEQATLVPERRQELTTEGGLDVLGFFDRIRDVTQKLKARGIWVSHFVEPDGQQIRRCADAGANAVELHTGRYAQAFLAGENVAAQLERLADAARYARSLGLAVYAGHGLTLQNVAAVAQLEYVTELNIGHGLVSHALFVGLAHAIEDFLRGMHKTHSAEHAVLPALSVR